MMNFRKMCFLMLVLVTGVLPAAADKIKIAPGAGCYVWNVNTRSKPSGVPVGGFVDESAAFSTLNIRKCEELAGIRQKAFIMWDGYLQIPADQSYRFTLTLPGGFDARRTNFKVFLDNTVVIIRNMEDKQMTVSGSARLKQGFVRLRIYANPTGGIQAKFLLKFAPVKEMKMTDITPAMLYHRVEVGQ